MVHKLTIATTRQVMINYPQRQRGLGRSCNPFKFWVFGTCTPNL